MNHLRTALLALVGGLALAATSASASWIVTPGATGTGINAINAPCTNPTGAPGTTIYGCLNIDHNQMVKFDSTDTMDFTAGGQAKIAPTATTFDNMSTSLFGKTFSTFVINIETDANGSVTFTDDLGDSSTQSLAKNGNNFFTFTGADFTWIKFVSTVDATDIKQVRFDGIATPGGGGGSGNPGVPEPATLALFGIALGSLGLMRRRRSKS